jgi:hypothetical protein
MHAIIDEAATNAGRDPSEIERAVNVIQLEGEPAGWPDLLARIATELRFTTIFIAVPDDDPVGFVSRLGQETAPALRELVA